MQVIFLEVVSLLLIHANVMDICYLRGLNSIAAAKFMNPFLRLASLLFYFGLLTACGGNSVNTSEQSSSDDSSQPDPSQLTITGGDEIASNSQHTLRATPEANTSGTWQWQFDSALLDVNLVEMDGDRLSYVAPDVNQTTELNFSLERVLSGGQVEVGSKKVTVFPEDDVTKQPQITSSEDTSGNEADEIQLSVQALAQSGRSIRSVKWQQKSGPVAQVISVDDQDVFVIQLPQVETDQVIVVTVLVQDSGGFAASAEIEIQVFDTLDNQLPEVEAGADQEVMANELVYLEGMASDGDGEVSAVFWEILAPYAELEVNQADTLTANFTAPNVTNDVDLQLRLTAFDDAGASASDMLTIRVLAVENQPPFIKDAYVDPGVAYSGETIQLVAVGQDPDGNALTYEWHQMVGDEQALLTIHQDIDGNASASLPILSKNEVFELELLLSDGVSTASKLVSFQGVARNAAAPDPLSCLLQPMASGCPLAPLAPVLDPDAFVACTGDIANTECIFVQIAGPAVLACIDNPSPQTCGTALTSITDPSYVLEQLGEEDSAGSCNPAYDDNSFEHYAGALHEHTAYSDGTFLTRPADVYARVKASGLDFVGSSDHSDNMGLPLSVGRGDCAPEEFFDCFLFVDPDNRSDAFVKWQATQEQALAASDETFTAFRGFEWTSDRFGHANVFFSRNIINAKTGPGYAVSMVRFWEWFSYPAQFGGGSDGLLSFNHPGREDAIESFVEYFGGDPGFTFNDFRYVPAADYRTVGIEVFGKGSEYDSDGPGGSWLSYALDKGWYLAPVGSEDHHDTRWGDGDLPKTVFIARSNSRDDLREAMLARRFYAVAQNYNDIRLDFSVDNHVMGSRLRRTVGTELLVKASMLSNGTLVTAPRFELIGPDNTVLDSSAGSTWETRLGFSSDVKYVFLRVLDGDRPIAFSAPIWLQEGTEPLPQCFVPQVWTDESMVLPVL
ncbi:Uncharacterised protein [Zhongshania aliphaticivorans]|uniref:Uncharacterized protein n=1 Tax=Zhongshania aliphaticivorans TaxID=1470434 RepID=A0A5S9PKB9_9GAMM|nr:PKD domain-containing protein [Zhongshania aliphaticivorans]CAA0104501.1 Uncharacterised protein [Zhongshania aliphaticivorans]CAA0104751.1 Uncharacterised protein [Zhongshania aliphaticivorans]